MIDTHCHVLPALDDGAADWEEALAMVRASVTDGIRQVIATPHWTGRPGETEEVRARACELTERLKSERLDYRIHLGNEVVLVPRLVECLDTKQAFCMGDSNYVLLETAQLERGAYTTSALFQIQSHGYRIVLAHPERVSSWQRDLESLRPLIERNCFLQITGGSLLGEFGNPARKCAEEMLRRGWVSIMASDGHGQEKRRPVLSEARQRCEALAGREVARMLVEDNPARILCNEQLPYVELDSGPSARRGGLLGFLRRD